MINHFGNKPTNEIIMSDCIDNYFSDKFYTKLMILLNNERIKTTFFKSLIDFPINIK